MKKTILHIGIYKTATTYLQKNIWPYLDDYTYLTRKYMQCNHAFNKLQYADDTFYDEQLVLNELKQINADKLLISDEALSGKPLMFSCINRTMIAERLKRVFPNAEIILFIRDQKDILLSYYGTYIRALNGSKLIEDLLYKPNEGLNYSEFIKKSSKYSMGTHYFNTNDFYLHLDCFLYSSMVRLYQSLFEKCHIFLYEDLVLDYTGTLARIETIVGERLPKSQMKRENMSSSDSELAKLRRNNLLKPIIGNDQLRRAINYVLGISRHPSYHTMREFIDQISSEYYTEDNLILKKMLPELSWCNHPDKYT